MGVSYDSPLSTTLDLSGHPTKSIFIEKPTVFKAPIGFKLRSFDGSVLDVVSTLYCDQPASFFEEVPYARLTHKQELIGVYGYYQAHYISHLGFLVKEVVTEEVAPACAFAVED